MNAAKLEAHLTNQAKIAAQQLQINELIVLVGALQGQIQVLSDKVELISKRQ